MKRSILCLFFAIQSQTFAVEQNDLIECHKLIERFSKLVNEPYRKNLSEIKQTIEENDLIENKSFEGMFLMDDDFNSEHETTKAKIEKQNKISELISKDEYYQEMDKFYDIYYIQYHYYRSQSKCEIFQKIDYICDLLFALKKQRKHFLKQLLNFSLN